MRGRVWYSANRRRATRKSAGSARVTAEGNIAPTCLWLIGEWTKTVGRDYRI
jgi:hypothetical protein